MKYFLILITFCYLAVGCATLKPVAISEQFLTNEDEQILWRQAQEEQEKIDGSGLLYHDPELENYLNKIAKKLVVNSISPDISIHVKVLNDPNLNAFAFPNGVIYVHTGILARMENEAQLAALLGHEITHTTHRHSLRVLRSIKNRPAYIAAVQKTIAKIAMIQELAQFLGATGAMAAVAGYTREFETTADQAGLDLTVKANYDPREALQLFEHLRQEIEIERIEEPFFFGTHPNVQQRIENVSNWLSAEYQGENTGIKNTEIFQSKLRRLVLDNARLDLQMGRFFIAQKGVKKYLRRNPDDAGAHYLLGEIFRQQDRQGDAATAIKHYAKAIALDSSFSAPHKAMGLMHYKEGERRLAKKFFETCLLLAPDAPDKAHIQGYLQRCTKTGEES